ncbi:MAG: hypothetical protein IJO56_01400 [Oscillospiraceae bacterium]|nr:hypothetical protein [Oscillospiraceae bacterium]
MKTIRTLVVMLFFFLALIGCNNSIHSEKGKCPTIPSTIYTNGNSHQIEEINTGILTVFNNVLYYHEDGVFHAFLDRQIEYELFFDPGFTVISEPKVYFIIENMEHPRSTAETTMLYKLGISISERGLQTDFSEISHVYKSEDVLEYLVEGGTYLGHHTALINNISAPIHEEMSEQWKVRAEAALRRYMSENDFYSDEQKNLPEGEYDVYIKGFSETDIDGTVVFVHEDGRVYRGEYYFVHNILDGQTADINRVLPIEGTDIDLAEFVDRIRQNAAFHMKYEVS